MFVLLFVNFIKFTIHTVLITIIQTICTEVIRKKSCSGKKITNTKYLNDLIKF